MERGLYIAATGMMSAQVRQDLIANNLANVSTIGFKADYAVNESFGDKLLYSMQSGGPIGTLNYGTRIAGTITDFSQGNFRNTEQPFDVAIGGDGFFRVRQSNGLVAYTRDGQFTRSPDGFLTTQGGEYVLDANNNPVFAGTEGDPIIRGDGTVSDRSGQEFGRISIATLDIPSARKVGANMWVGRETGGMPQTSQLKQGFVEASGVNSVQAMVQMIETLRSYESSQRVITSIDGTLDKAVNSVGTLG
jgi:flagellar basal-body rod protein FlgF